MAKISAFLPMRNLGSGKTRVLAKANRTHADKGETRWGLRPGLLPPADSLLLFSPAFVD